MHKAAVIAKDFKQLVFLLKGGRLQTSVLSRKTSLCLKPIYWNAFKSSFDNEHE